MKENYCSPQILQQEMQLLDSFLQYSVTTNESLPEFTTEDWS